MPQRYDADSLFVRLNQLLPPRTTLPNPGGILHPAVGGFGLSDSIGNIDLLDGKSEGPDAADDLASPWTPDEHVDCMASSPGRCISGYKVRSTRAMPALYGADDERARRLS